MLPPLGTEVADSVSVEDDEEWLAASTGEAGPSPNAAASRVAAASLIQ
jgi:hypothetical protein